jgi:hypothetical protein
MSDYTNEDLVIKLADPTRTILETTPSGKITLYVAGKPVDLDELIEALHEIRRWVEDNRI